MNEIDEKVEELKTVEERVRWLLEKHPQARNSDIYLIILYWRKFDGLPLWFPKNYIFGDEKVTSPASIVRARRKIQERGELLPTDPEILRKRRRLQAVYARYSQE